MFLWLAFPGPASAADVDTVRVSRPGEILFSRDERRAELAAAGEAMREALCTTEVKKWRSHTALTTVEAPDEYGTDLRAEPFALTVMWAAAHGYGAGDAAAQAALVGLLDRWAKGKALTRFDARVESNYYTINRTLLPTIVAWGLVRDEPGLDKKRRKRIEDWLARVVRLRGEQRAERDERAASARNNHLYLDASVSMAWGALQGDEALFRQGIEAYRRALADMRPDGSLPLETERGARALWYQRHAIASLVVIAEMAAVQGYDLYGLDVGEGRSLHRALRFLLDAVADQRLVWPYAEANVNPGPSRNYFTQDLGFLTRRGHGRHYMAWAEPYLRRFPERPEARDLLALLDRAQPDFRPMVDEYSGGNTSCFFARAAPRAERESAS
ncbi:MAG TPA: alginate lyase family protein [Geminicoccaceae bacterium]|nr:alginate lyase family protein [Geminicoccaceae bacterium]